MSSPESDSIVLLNLVMVYMNRYLAIAIFLFGFVGNVLNIFALSQRNLRSNPCGWFFLLSSIAYLISIISGLSTRILSGWNLDLTDTISWLCKLRTFIVFTSRTIAFWLLVFATSDRWLSSSANVHFRQLSTLKNSHRISFTIALISTLIHIEMFYCYEANLLDTPLKCYGKTAICRHFNDIMYACLTISIPLILMLIFGLLTILNVRRTQHRVQIVNNEPNPASRRNEKLLKRKIDRHLLKMLFVEVILLTLLTFPQAIQKFYSTTTTNDANKSAYDITMDTFLYNVAVLLSFIASGMPFYIYTLCGGNIFRKALFNIFKC